MKLLVLVALCAWWAPARGAAEECGREAKRWVAVRLSGPGWDPALADAVLTDLRAEVVRHGIDACAADTSGLPAPVAAMEIQAKQPAAMHLVLTITEPAGGRSERELQLDSIPLDGHSLAVAVAADELLTSSLIKLASPPAAAPPPPALPRPPEQLDATAPVAGETPRRYELAALAVAERFGDAAWAEGVDLSLRRWLLPRWAVELSAGARTSVEERAAHGRIHTRAMPLSLRVLLGLLPFSARARAGAATALTASPLFLSASPDGDAKATAHAALAVYLRGELWADVAFGRFRLRVGGGAGLPLRSVTADDSGVAGGGAHGLELHAQLGLGVEL